MATGSAATIRRHSRRMDAAAARPWRVLVLGAVLFAVAQLLAGSFPGPAFDGLAADDVRDDLERGLRSLASITRTAQEHGLLLVVDGVASPGTAAEVRAAGAGLVQGEAAPCDLTSSDVSLLLRGREPAATH